MKKTQFKIKDIDNIIDIVLTNDQGYELRIGTDSVLGRSIYKVVYRLLGGYETKTKRNAVMALLLNYVNEMLQYYRLGSYSYIPLYDDIELTAPDYCEILEYKMIKEFNKQDKVLKLCTIEGLNELSFNRELSINTTKGGKDTITKDYDTTINGENTLKSVNEIAPINASLDIIDTPNEKSINKNSNESKKTGSDTIDTIYGGTVNDIHKEISPELYEKFLKILDKYNIPQIIENIYRTIIYEFNMSL